MAFDAGRITASLDLDRSPFTRSLAAARKSAADFARQTYQASLGVRGSAGAIGELKAVNAEADRVDGRDVELDVDKDGSASSHLQSLSGGFKSLAGNIRATGTVLAASAIPFLIAGIGAATPAILALGASLAGLALNLGKAAAGFGLVGAAAGGGALVGLKAYSSLISKTLTDSRDLWAKSNEEAVKALEKQRTEILLNARGFNAWNSELNESILRFTRLEAAVGSKVFPIFTRELDAWNEIITQFSPKIANTSGRIAQIATGFTRWFRTADDGRVLSEVVDFLSESAVRAARALSQLGQIGISAFRPLIPLAVDLQGSVLGILSATNRWVQSAEGQRKLGQIYRSLFEDAKRLAPVVMDLWRGTVQLFDALDRTGIADQASRGFAALASAYERATRAGGGLDDFLRGALRLMPFVGRATEDVVGAIFGIARAAIGAREKGSRLTILQQIFRGIGNAAKPLQSLVVGTFRDLGPVIARLLPALSRFFATFAGSSGPLVAFARTITSVLQAFNRLPAPIRNAAAQLLALKIILGGLGLGAVIAPLGRFASNMVLASGAAAKLGGRSALLGVVGSLTKLGGLLVGGIGLGLLVAGLVRAYNKNEQFRNSVNRLGDKAKEAFGGIQRTINRQVLPALSHLADKGANALIDIFDLNQNKIKNNADKARKSYRKGILGEGNFWHEVGFKLGRLTGAGLNAYANSGKAKDLGLNLSKKVRSGFNPVWVGEQIGQGMKIGINKTNWHNVGERITEQLGAAATNPAALNFIKNKLGDAYRWAVKNINWKSIGNLLVTLFFAPIAPMMSEKSKKNIITPIRNAINAGDWGKLGNNAGFGFMKGFGKAVTPNGLVNIVKNAIDAVRKFGKEGSPWGLTEDMGRNAALGFVKGWGDNIGRLYKALDRALKAGKPLVAHRIGEMLEARNAYRLNPLRNVRGKPVRQWDMGDPREMVRTILNSRASTIDRNWARYLALHAGDLSDKERFRHADDFKRIAERMRQLGFSMFEDFTFKSNDAMRRYQRGPQGGSRQGGHKPLDEDGMRRVMREHRSQRGGDAIDYNRLAHAIVGAMQSGLPGFIDNSMGTYFHHRNQAGADPR